MKTTTLTNEVNFDANTVSSLIAPESVVKEIIKDNPDFKHNSIYDYVCVETGNVYSFVNNRGHFTPINEETKKAYYNNQEITID